MRPAPYTVDNPRKGYCHASVMSAGGWHHHQCGRKAKNTEKGHEWCGQHTPSVIQKREEAKDSERRARNRRRDARDAADRKAEKDKANELKTLRAENKKLRAKVERLEKSVAHLTGNGGT